MSDNKNNILNDTYASAIDDSDDEEEEEDENLYVPPILPDAAHEPKMEGELVPAPTPIGRTIHAVRTFNPVFTNAPKLTLRPQLASAQAWGPGPVISYPLLSPPEFFVNGKSYFGRLEQVFDDLCRKSKLSSSSQSHNTSTSTFPPETAGAAPLSSSSAEPGPGGPKAVVAIIGWMLSLDMVLSPNGNNEKNGKGKTLLQALKALKSSGVQIGIIVWEDKSGFGGTGAKDVKEALAAEHFVEKEDFVLGRANVSGGSVWWSTHQKTVTVFDPWDNDSNKQGGSLTSYVGGFDLAVGRYGDSRKIVFRDELTEEEQEKGEYDSHLVNSFLDEPLSVSDWNARGLARMPWHDVQVRLEGYTCYILLKVWDFFWRVAGGNPSASCLRTCEGGQEDPVAYKGFSNCFGCCSSTEEPDLTLCANREIFETLKQQWFSKSGIQFISSSSHSSTTTTTTSSTNNTNKKNHPPASSTETEEKNPPPLYQCQLYHSAPPQEGTPSIHHAWVQGILTARESIYIEQQFFQGWTSPKMEKRVTNLIPWAIVQRIKQVVAERGPLAKFHAYIIMPLVPDPEHQSLTGITPGAVAKRMMLRFHSDTRRYIRRELGSAWRQYVTFLYLSRRIDDKEYPIYVHNKMMIVDDEVCFLGSANVNDRSLRGDGDAELCCVIEDVARVLENGSHPAGPSTSTTDNTDTTTSSSSRKNNSNKNSGGGSNGTKRDRIRDLRLKLMCEHAEIPRAECPPEFYDPASRACVDIIQQATTPPPPGSGGAPSSGGGGGVGGVGLGRGGLLGRLRQFPDDGLATTAYFANLPLDGGAVKKYMVMYDHFGPDNFFGYYLAA